MNAPHPQQYIHNQGKKEQTGKIKKHIQDKTKKVEMKIE